MELNELRALSSIIQDDLEKEGFQTISYCTKNALMRSSQIKIIKKNIIIYMSYHIKKGTITLSLPGDLIITKENIVDLKKVSSIAEQSITNYIAQQDKKRLQLLLNRDKVINNQIKRTIKEEIKLWKSMRDV